MLFKTGDLVRVGNCSAAYTALIVEFFERRVPEICMETGETLHDHVEYVYLVQPLLPGRQPTYVPEPVISSLSTGRR